MLCYLLCSGLLSPLCDTVNAEVGNWQDGKNKMVAVIIIIVITVIMLVIKMYPSCPSMSFTSVQAHASGYNSVDWPDSLAMNFPIHG